ncbi:MAG: 30S ribosomal protein S20 [Candidatus Absconditabacterales bacterium]
MPITKSAKKAAKRSLILQSRNNEFKFRMKMEIKKFIKNVSKGIKSNQEDLNKIYKIIDKCAKIGIIKKKTAARKKSRVAKLFNKNDNLKEKKST